MSAPYIAVAGRYKGDDGAILALADEVGEQVGKSGCVLLTGGGPGVMEAACRGCKRAGGTTVAYLAGKKRCEANSYVDFALPTGLGWELRSELMVRACDALILVGGAAGSLGETLAAYAQSKPIVVLAGSGGWADRLPGALVDGAYIDERRHTELRFAKTPRECVELAVSLVRG